jgi:tight adherence protein C
MRVLLPAMLATGAFVLAVRGFVMLREPGPLVRLETAAPRRRTREARRGPMRRLLDFLGTRLGPRLLRVMGARRADRVGVQLDQAGHPDGMTVDEFYARKAALTALGLVAAVLLLLSGSAPLLALPVAFIGWFGLDIWLARAARLRQERLERDLPDFLDILAVTVKAGLGYRDALARVSRELGGPVGEEITTALRGMELGASRREALEALRERNSSEALDQFVTAQLQAEELGVPLAEALNSLADDMRRDAYQAARRRAARAAPRISLIVTTVIVPGAVLLILVALFLGSDVQLDELGS